MKHTDIKKGQIWRSKPVDSPLAYSVKVVGVYGNFVGFIVESNNRIEPLRTFREKFDFYVHKEFVAKSDSAQFWVKNDSLAAGSKVETRECPKCGIEYSGLESLLMQTNKMCQICRYQEKIRNETKSPFAQALRQAVNESIQKKPISWNERWPESFWSEKGDKAKGVKSDNNKRRYSLLPAGTINEVVDVLEFGSAKYADDNWQKVDNARTRYYNAALRHIDSWWDGEVKDDETGKHHLAHAICCLMFLMWFDLSAHKNTEKGK